MPMKPFPPILNAGFTPDPSYLLESLEIVANEIDAQWGNVAWQIRRRSPGGNRRPVAAYAARLRCHPAATRAAGFRHTVVGR